MRIAGRWLLVALLAVSLVHCSGAFAGAGPGRPGRRPGGAAPAPIAREARILAVNYDLQGKKPQLSAQAQDQLRANLMYLEPDLVVLHSVQRSLVEGEQRSSLSRVASALGMYYVFQATTDSLGSVLLSRFRIENARCLNAPAPSGAAVGLRATIDAPGGAVTVFVARPPSSQVDRGAIDAVAQDAKGTPASRTLVFASFNAGGGASAALASWLKAGLVDPSRVGARRAGAAMATYPSSKPAQRADLILVSASLKPQVESYRVLQPRRVQEISDHLPVVLVLRR